MYNRYTGDKMLKIFKTSEFNIFLLLFNILMLIVNFLVGPSIIKPITSIYFVIILITFVYLLFNIKKIRIISNKIDLCVILYFISIFIPLIFESYMSLEKHYWFILQNVSMLCIYILVKNLSLNEKNKSKIVDILIFSSIPIVIIGFDRLYTNFIWDYISNINIFKVSDNSGRLVANFNYANSLAIYLSCILMLSLGKILNVKKSKIVYKSYVFLLLLLIILTQSRATILLSLIFLILYVFLLKNKDDFIKIIYTLLISIFGIILYFILFNIFDLTTPLKFVVLFSTNIVVVLCNLIANKKKLFSNKTFCVIFIIILLFIIYFTIAFSHSKPTIVTKSTIYNISNIKSNSEYELKVDLNIYKKTDDNTKIIVTLIDENRYKKNIIDEKIDTFKGIKKYKIKTLENTSYVRISFKNDDSINNTFKVNKIYLDDKEYIINYKYIPNILANKIKTIRLNDKSLEYRFDYYKDCFKIIKDNFFTGVGSRGWDNLYKSIQSYKYTAREVHSFILDTFINLGIFGFLSLLSIIISLLCYGIKLLKNKTDKNYKLNLNILITLFLLFSHSIMDFDMSFFLVYLFFFILIAIISSNFNREVKSKIILNILYSILFFIFLVTNLFDIIVGYKVKGNLFDGSTEIIINRYDNLIKFNPINSELKYQNILNVQNYLAKLNNNKIINSEMEVKLFDDMLRLYDEEITYKNDIETIIINYVINELKAHKINENHIKNLMYVIKTNNYNEKFNIEDIIDKTKVYIRLYKLMQSRGEKYNSEFLLNQKDELKKIVISNYEKNVTIFDDFTITGHYENHLKKSMKRYKDYVEKLKNS